MNTPEKQFFRLSIEFVTMQHELLMCWLHTNSTSCDLEMLLDFPKRCTIIAHSVPWEAIKHGLGVRFVRPDGLTVDVPTAVDQPHAIDSDRLVEVLLSSSPKGYELLPDDRESFSAIFESLVASNVFIKHADSQGRPLFSILHQ